jgi:hypothetical protein
MRTGANLNMKANIVSSILANVPQKLDTFTGNQSFSSLFVWVFLAVIGYWTLAYNQ